MGNSKKGFRGTGMAIGLGLLAAAVVTEMRKPAEERTGTGTVAGVVPYDFRPPTISRFREAFWAPEDPQIFKPHVFGVGWSVNIGRIVALLMGKA